MLLSNNYANKIESSLGTNHRLASSSLDKSEQLHREDKLVGEEQHQQQLLPATQLYQHLYYYALQQQLNSAFANQTNNETNLVNRSPGASQTGYGHGHNHAKKAHRNKFKKSNSNRFESHKQNKSHRFVEKTCKTNVKSSAEQIDYDHLEQNDWIEKGRQEEDNEVSDIEDDEMKCHCTDDLVESEVEQGEKDNKCAARSRCRKLRRNRTVFTELQLMGLERRFDSQKYLSTPDRADLARALGLSQLQVKTWYQNRRMKWKKQVSFVLLSFFV